MSATVGGEKAACKHRDQDSRMDQVTCTMPHGASADRSTHSTCTFFITTYHAQSVKRYSMRSTRSHQVSWCCTDAGKPVRLYAKARAMRRIVARWHPKQRSDGCSSRGLGIERRTGKGDHSSARSLRAPAGSRSSARTRKPETLWSSGTMQGVCREPRALVTC